MSAWGAHHTTSNSTRVQYSTHCVHVNVHTHNIILTVWRYSGCAGPGGCVTPSDSMVSSRWATECEGVENEEGGGRGVVWGMRGEVGTEGDHRPIGQSSALVHVHVCT